MSVLHENATLRWKPLQASDHDWRDVELAPATNSGFVEKQCYVFSQPTAGFSLYIDDEPLSPLANQVGVWDWRPGFFAGEVTGVFQRLDGTSAGSFLLDVAPDPGKVGREVFETMLKELWAEDPILVIGEEPAKTAGGELGTLEDPWVAFARLRRYMPEFFRALADIRRSPRRSLRVRRDSSPLHHVRRVDYQTALSVLRSPAVALLMPHLEDAPVVSPHSRVDVPSIEETVDAAANRAILAMLRALLRRTTTVLDRLEDAVNREQVSDTRTPLAARWPARKTFLNNVIMQLGIVLRNFPFTEVQRPEVTAAGLTAIATDPSYARTWSRGWRALRNGFESDTETERLWISPSWEIYERWCFLQLGKLLASSLPTWQWHLLRKPWRWIGTESGARAELRLQPTFRARSELAVGRWSISKERVPDLVLTVEHGGETRLLVLDAKYRTSRQAVLDAMESAHIYQDSLRIGHIRPEATLLLVPTTSDVAWLATPQFIGEHRVGVFSLMPGETTSLPEVVTSLFRLSGAD